jgi:hypothetical protein
VKTQLSAPIEADNDMFVFGSGGIRRNQIKTAGHSKVHQKRVSVVDIKNKVLTPAPDGGKSTLFYPATE